MTHKRQTDDDIFLCEVVIRVAFVCALSFSWLRFVDLICLVHEHDLSHPHSIFIHTNTTQIYRNWKDWRKLFDSIHKNKCFRCRPRHRRQLLCCCCCRSADEMCERARLCECVPVHCSMRLSLWNVKLSQWYCDIIFLFSFAVFYYMLCSLFNVLFLSIGRHPLFSLLALMLEKCEQATQGYIPKPSTTASSSSSPNGTSNGSDSDSFTKDIQAFVQMLEKENRPLLTNDAELDGLVSDILSRIHDVHKFILIFRVCFLRNIYRW